MLVRDYIQAVERGPSLWHDQIVGSVCGRDCGTDANSKQEDPLNPDGMVRLIRLLNACVHLSEAEYVNGLHRGEFQLVVIRARARSLSLSCVQNCRCKVSQRLRFMRVCDAVASVLLEESNEVDAAAMIKAIRLQAPLYFETRSSKLDGVYVACGLGNSGCVCIGVRCMNMCSCTRACGAYSDPDTVLQLMNVLQMRTRSWPHIWQLKQCVRGHMRCRGWYTNLHGSRSRSRSLARSLALSLARGADTHTHTIQWALGTLLSKIYRYKLEIFNKILVLTLGPTEQVRLSGLQHFKKGVRTASCVRSSVLRSSSSRARSRSCLDASSRI